MLILIEGLSNISYINNGIPFLTYQCSQNFKIQNIQLGASLLFCWWKYTAFLTSRMAICIKCLKNIYTVYSNNSASRKF